jgi:hypothetical protein
MTDKLVVIINRLKYKLQLPPEPLTRGLPPPDPGSLCPQLSLLNPPPPNKIPGYATGRNMAVPHLIQKWAIVDEGPLSFLGSFRLMPG